MANLSWNEITDRAVDRLCCREPFVSDAERVAMLFEQYQKEMLHV